MRIKLENNISDFLNKNEEALLIHESEHNLLLGLARGIFENKRPSSKGLFYSLESSDGSTGQAIRTDPDKPLILSMMDKNFILPLVEYLKNQSIELKGVIGPIELANLFKENWQASSKIGMHQGIYQLDKVIHPDYFGGELVLFTKKEAELAYNFCLGFVKDCFPLEKNPEEVAQEASQRHIENESLWYWRNKNSEIVSIAGNTRQTKNGATISWVYTPKELRGQGYASRTVAALSEKLLEQKKFTNLFTDLLNPTSNSIYRKIGYQKIAESIHFNFT